ncbi:hypothetical protein BH24ACT26_BH24ACT26_01270 [soil metagenome]
MTADTTTFVRVEKYALLAAALLSLLRDRSIDIGLGQALFGSHAFSVDEDLAPPLPSDEVLTNGLSEQLAAGPALSRRLLIHLPSKLRRQGDGERAGGASYKTLSYKDKHERTEDQLLRPQPEA